MKKYKYSNFTDAAVGDKVIHKDGYLGKVMYVEAYRNVFPDGTTPGYVSVELYDSIHSGESAFNLDGTDATDEPLIWLYEDVKRWEYD